MRPRTAEDYLDYFLMVTKAEDSMRPRNMWLDFDPTLKVYVRRAHRLLGPRTLGSRLTTVLDIANVEATPTGQGRFRKFLTHVETFEPWEGVFVENVMSERFKQFFRKRGYKEVDYDPILEPSTSSFYKLWNKNN